jgi:hypothetical protein
VLITLYQKDLPRTNTLAYWAHLPVKEIAFWEQFKTLYYIRNLSIGPIS